MDPTEKEAAVGEYKVNYASLGNGEPLFLLHGSEPKESWRVWEPLFPLADTYKLIAPDLLGHGKSSKPLETPDHRLQAHMLKDLADRLGVHQAGMIGGGWGGQVALEFALEWPDCVSLLVLLASSYDVEQIPRLQKLRKPALIIFAEDDMLTQLKAGYLLRDAIGTSRLEVLEPVAKDPRYDFRMSHRLQKFRGPQVLQLARSFLSRPWAMVAEPPEMENELRGQALRKEDEKDGAIWKKTSP
ncbi:MAG: alpha/beta hydrolase [Nitrososphaerota archaeon]|nr:alpha/beta hydrolase [Nitrososphaerota archaeon]MDG6941860.1 alpha/beta hydrolase [Nitrososphaerota archaeon]MDG6946967.1 alpha/beta hydrolase [Nitrososphaerota archaeon]MDG6950621.1 alpha/beta hydrolase [Nitrososphaerota archaeon]